VLFMTILGTLGGSRVKGASVESRIGGKTEMLADLGLQKAEDSRVLRLGKL